MRGRQTEKLEKMQEFAEVLKKREMTEKECTKYLGMTQQNFRTFITSMTERFLVYEYKTQNKSIVYGLLK